MEHYKVKLTITTTIMMDGSRVITTMDGRNQKIMDGNRVIIVDGNNQTML